MVSVYTYEFPADIKLLNKLLDVILEKTAFSTVDEVATKFALINFDVLILPIVAFDDVLISPVNVTEPNVDWLTTFSKSEITVPIVAFKTVKLLLTYKFEVVKVFTCTLAPVASTSPKILRLEVANKLPVVIDETYKFCILEPSTSRRVTL